MKTLLLALAISIQICSAQECGPHGNSKPGTREYDLNVFKNRMVAPATVDSGISLAEVLKLGDDARRFSNEQAATITGYVALVKDGGPESCNCGSTTNKDTHIALVANPAEAEDKSKHVVVEVSPHSRELFGLPGTKQLKGDILHKWVKITGWLFADLMHTHNAANTNPQGKAIWRATITEIHPVTKIEVLK